MLFAELLPKTISPKEEGELIFCSGEEGLREACTIRPAGKILIVTDASAFKAFCSGLPPRALCLVLDSDDALPLFACSDDVSLVIASGRDGTLRAARFFAQIRKIPCALFPVSATLDGALERAGQVRLGDTVEEAPFKEAKIYCDQTLLAPSLGQAYMRLLLTRLNLIEAKALRGMDVAKGCEQAEERAYHALLSLSVKTLDGKEVICKNAQIRKCEQEGMPRGEGIRLAEDIGYQGEEQAFFLLLALYSAFFFKGKPRLKIPDYAARAQAAEAAYCKQRVPTLLEFAHRTTALERIRAEILRELFALSAGETHFRKNFYALTGRAPAPIKSVLSLKHLPERALGLCSVMRDFGLMEWNEDIFTKSV